MPVGDRIPSRRGFLKAAGGALLGSRVARGASAKRPNILLCISDDQSHPHASAYGYPAANTPHFDRVAREGVLFHNAFCPSPGCSPCRAALLTGRHTWQLEQAGTHASSFPGKYKTYPELLAEAGYWTGYTGKGWGPGRWQDERSHNPAGPVFNGITSESPPGIRSTDYAGNFEQFLKQRPEGAPFCFWYGASEPHRPFEKGAGLRAGKKLEDAPPPPFLPDRPGIRSDILDYALEIEHFDGHLGRILAKLEEAGELEDTLIIVTSDNGMAFPRAKANVYEYGIHIPLAIRWGARTPAGREVDDLTGFVDLTATILEAAGVSPPEEYPPSGKSILPILESDESGLIEPERDAVFAARERHSSSRYNNWTYPQRAIRTRDYLYIRNFKPDRWPAGAPQKYGEDGKLGPMHGAYHDIDASPTLTFLIENREDPEIGRFFHLAVDKRPAEELFDVRNDPGCLENLAQDASHAGVRRRLRDRLEGYLRETGDPRASGNGGTWESYPRYSPIRKFPPPE